MGNRKKAGRQMVLPRGRPENQKESSEVSESDRKPTGPVTLDSLYQRYQALNGDEEAEGKFLLEEVPARLSQDFIHFLLEKSSEEPDDEF